MNAITFLWLLVLPARPAGHPLPPQELGIRGSQRSKFWKQEVIFCTHNLLLHLWPWQAAEGRRIGTEASLKSSAGTWDHSKAPFPLPLKQSPFFLPWTVEESPPPPTISTRRGRGCVGSKKRAQYLGGTPPSSHTHVSKQSEFG